MKSRSLMTTLAALCTALALLASGAPAQAGLFNNLPQVIVLVPGHDQTRSFYLNDEFDLNGFSNAQSFLLIAIKDFQTASDCGVLTITLSTTATITFGASISYDLSGFAYPVGGTFDNNNFYATHFTTPAKATKTLNFNSEYGVGSVTALISKIDGVVTQPVPMTIVFSLAAKKA